MSKLNETDIQGFVLRGYNLPFARYMFLHLEAKPPTHPPEQPTPAQKFIRELLGEVTTGQRWDAGHKPESTVNIAFTHKGLEALELPDATLLSFPVEFQQGMKKRGRRFWGIRGGMLRRSGTGCGDVAGGRSVRDFQA